MIRKIITGNEISGNGFLAMQRNSPTHRRHAPERRRKSLSVKLANMSGFLAAADTLLFVYGYHLM